MESLGTRLIDLPDTDKEITRIVSKESLVQLARELRDQSGFSNEEISDILAECTEIFKKG